MPALSRPNERVLTPEELETAVVNKLTKFWYRATRKSDGTLWCESSNPDEVIQASRDVDCWFAKYPIFWVETGWEDWDV